MRSPISSPQPVGEKEVDSPFSVAESEKEKRYFEWSKREMSWYKSENRLLLMAANAMELQKWLIVLQWVISGCDGASY